MARQMRSELADMRAMEEEAERMNPVNPKKEIGTRKGYTGIIRGSGSHIVGAGATPSMGLSQFRGGKKSASAVGKKALELHKMEHEAMESEAHGMGRHLGTHITSLHGSGFFSDFAKGLMSVAKVAKPLLGMVPHPAAQAASGVLGALGAGDMSGGMDTGAYEGKGKRTHKVKRAVGANDGRRKRAEVVKKVMKERGISMIEASKIVKSEGLY